MHRLKSEELMNNATEAQKRCHFDKLIKSKYSDSIISSNTHIIEKFSSYKYDEEYSNEVPAHNLVVHNGTQICEQPFYDHLIHTKVTLPQGE